MRKHLFLGLFLPFILVLSIMGTGFAVWFFGGIQSKSNNNQVQVETSAKDCGMIYLQYGNEGDENFISFQDDKSKVEPFLYITQTDVEFPSPMTAKFVFKKRGTDEETSAYYHKFRYSLQYEVTVSETFDSYFKLVYPTTSSTDARKANGYLSFSDKSNVKGLPFDNTWINHGWALGRDINNVYEYPSLPIIVNYRSGAIPTSKVAFEAMWNRLEDSQKTAPLIKISIYLTIESYKEKEN